MKYSYYAYTVKADKGWIAVLADMDGGEHFVEVNKWGVTFNEPTRLIPLDALEVSFYDKTNFVTLLDPNEEPDMNNIRLFCKSKAKKMRAAQK